MARLIQGTRRIIAPTLSYFQSATKILPTVPQTKPSWIIQRVTFADDTRSKLPKVHLSQTNEDWSENSYHEVADETLESLYNYLDDHVASVLIETPDFDVSLSQGILTIELPGKGTYVINKQPANREIWASSPVSGPSRFGFKHSEKIWEYPRNNVTLHKMLNEEFRSFYPQKSDAFNFIALPFGAICDT